MAFLPGVRLEEPLTLMHMEKRERGKKPTDLKEKMMLLAEFHLSGLTLCSLLGSIIPSVSLDFGI